jgi:hypothetical protein
MLHAGQMRNVLRFALGPAALPVFQIIRINVGAYVACYPMGTECHCNILVI